MAPLRFFSMRSTRGWVGLHLLLPLMLAAGCQRQAPQQMAPMPPTVSIAQPLQMPVTDFREFTGETEAVATVDIRARVQGFLEEIHFVEGTEVKKDAPLYTIDPRTFQAEVDRAAAELERLKAQLSLAINEENRTARLRKSSAVTEEEYVQRVATREQAEASVQEAQAALDLAKINLSFTQITAPIAGRIGRTQYTVGNLVGYNEPTLLTTLVQLDPIYVFFDATERGFFEYEQRRTAEGTPADKREVPVFVSLPGETDFPHRGVIGFRETQVDPGTGTFRLRATIANPNRIIAPGMFARIRVPIGPPTPQLLIPQVALSADQRGNYVMVLGNDNTAEYRPIETGRYVGDLVIVTKGLTQADRVIVNGIQKARLGAKVTPEVVEIKPPSAEDLRGTSASPIGPMENDSWQDSPPQPTEIEVPMSSPVPRPGAASPPQASQPRGENEGGAEPPPSVNPSIQQPTSDNPQ